MNYWDIRQYVREIRTGNVGLRELLRVLLIAIFNFTHEQVRGWRRYPFMDSKLIGQNPEKNAGELGLKPGEIVQIKSKEEIINTLNGRSRNKGLLFDKEMVKYCGRKVKVLKRVNKIIEESTGRMITMKNECIILEGVVCCGEYSEDRLLCPRSIYPFWREIWLKRI
jgi:hypothetical protein